MEILRVTIAAGERKTFHKSGRYFEVMKASAPFDVHFTDRQIGVYPCLELEAGVYSEMPFQVLEVVSSVAQTVTLMISDFRAGFRAGGAASGGGGVAAGSYPTDILWDDSPAVAAFTPSGGRVSGGIKSLAPSTSGWLSFDLGDDYQRIDSLTINCNPKAGTTISISAVSMETGTPAPGVGLTYRYSTALTAFSGSFSTGGLAAILQPSGRFAGFFYSATAAGTAADAYFRLQRNYK